MESFADRLAVVTGGGSGMGRELVRQLSAGGCAVATCDVSPESLEETKASCDGRVTTFVADVSDEAQVLAFRDAVARDHETDHLHLLFNNAGIGGGGSFVADDRVSGRGPLRSAGEGSTTALARSCRCSWRAPRGTW